MAMERKLNLRGYIMPNEQLKADKTSRSWHGRWIWNHRKTQQRVARRHQGMVPDGRTLSKHSGAIMNRMEAACETRGWHQWVHGSMDGWIDGWSNIWLAVVPCTCQPPVFTNIVLYFIACWVVIRQLIAYERPMSFDALYMCILTLCVLFERRDRPNILKCW